jgi:hypothetical protein
VRRRRQRLGGAGRNAYDAGPGKDRIKARNDTAEIIRCGSGRDSVVADPGDELHGCERDSR